MPESSITTTLAIRTWPRASDSLLSLLLLLSGGATGCSDREDAARRENIEALEEFVEALSVAMCHWQFRCCSLPEIDATGRSRFLTESECGPAVASAVDQRLSEIRAGILEDRVFFDPQLAASCIAEFADAACGTKVSTVEPLDSPLWTKFSRCPNPTVGRLPAGAPCFLPSECQPGQSCRTGGEPSQAAGLTVGGARAVPAMADRLPGVRGHCTPDTQVGGSCSLTRECAPGLHCRGTDFVCAAPAREGEACVGPLDEKGIPVSTIVACSDRPERLICMAGVCRRLPREGEPCLPEAFDIPVCDPAPHLDLACAGQELNGTGFCKRAAAQGEVCSVSRALPGCAMSLACTVSSDGLLGICELAPGAGQSCSAEGRCASPAVCYAGAFTCVVPPAAREGSSCTSDLDCASLRCLRSLGSRDGDGQPGVCVQVALAPVCRGPGSFVVPAGNPPRYMEPGPGVTATTSDDVPADGAEQDHVESWLAPH